MFGMKAIFVFVVVQLELCLQMYYCMAFIQRNGVRKKVRQLYIDMVEKCLIKLLHVINLGQKTLDQHGRKNGPNLGIILKLRSQCF